MYCRCNPDADLRRLERIFQQDPTPENRNRLNDARMRAGLPLILDIPAAWQEWARDYPPSMAISIPEHIYAEVDNYIEAVGIAEHIEIAEDDAGNALTCMVLFYNHVFYVVPKHSPELSWLCSKCRTKMSYQYGRWVCKECGWKS
jgi:hypothetical protein